jgi:hypothetical protein
MGNKPYTNFCGKPVAKNKTMNQETINRYKSTFYWQNKQISFNSEDWEKCKDFILNNIKAFDDTMKINYVLSDHLDTLGYLDYNGIRCEIINAKYFCFSIFFDDSKVSSKVKTNKFSTNVEISQEVKDTINASIKGMILDESYKEIIGQIFHEDLAIIIKKGVSSRMNDSLYVKIKMVYYY